MRYPEEIDHQIWPEYTKTDDKIKYHEVTTIPDDDGDSFGLYTVMSQVSRSRRLSSASAAQEVSRDPSRSAQQHIVIGWLNENDIEVGNTYNLKIPRKLVGKSKDLLAKEEPEPPELEHPEKALRQLPDLATDFFCLYRLCYLHSWNPGSLKPIRGE